VSCDPTGRLLYQGLSCRLTRVLGANVLQRTRPRPDRPPLTPAHRKKDHPNGVRKTSAVMLEVARTIVKLYDLFAVPEFVQPWTRRVGRTVRDPQDTAWRRAHRWRLSRAPVGPYRSRPRLGLGPRICRSHVRKCSARTDPQASIATGKRSMRSFVETANSRTSMDWRDHGAAGQVRPSVRPAMERGGPAPRRDALARRRARMKMPSRNPQADARLEGDNRVPSPRRRSGAEVQAGSMLPQAWPPIALRISGWVARRRLVSSRRPTIHRCRPPCS